MEKATTNVNITAEIKQALETLVNDLGGIISASNFLNIGQPALKGYLDGTKTQIRKDIWNNSLFPVLNKDKEELIKKYAAELKRLRIAKDYTDYYLNHAKHVTNIRNEQIQELLSSPFSVYFGEFVNEWEHSYAYPILEDIMMISSGKEVPKDKLIRDVDELRRLYELFRPEKITTWEPYYGTVKIMDRIFKLFAAVFRIKYNSKFSKYGSSWIEDLFEPKKIELSDAPWDLLMDDLNHVINCINETMAKLALDSISYFQIVHSPIFKYLVYNYLMKRFKIDQEYGFNQNDIYPGYIKNERCFISFQNRDELFNKLREFE